MSTDLFHTILDQLQEVEDGREDIPQELFENVGNYLNPNDYDGMDELAEILTIYIKRHGFDTVKSVLREFAQDKEGIDAVSELIQENIRDKWIGYSEELEIVGNLLADVVIQLPKVKDLKTPETIGAEDNKPIIKTVYVEDLSSEYENFDPEELRSDFFDGNVESYAKKSTEVYERASEFLEKGETGNAFKLFGLAMDLMKAYMDRNELTDDELKNYIDNLLLSALPYMALKEDAKAIEITSEATDLAKELFNRNQTAEIAEQVLGALHEQILMCSSKDFKKALTLSEQAMDLVKDYTRRFPDKDFRSVASRIELVYANSLYQTGRKKKGRQLFDKVIEDRRRRTGKINSYIDVADYFKSLQSVGSILSEDKKVEAADYYIKGALLLNKIPMENLTEDNLNIMRQVLGDAALIYDKRQDYKHSLEVNKKIVEIFEGYMANGIILPITIADIVISIQGVVSNTLCLTKSSKVGKKKGWFKSQLNRISHYAELGLALYPDNELSQTTYRQALAFIDRTKKAIGIE